MACMLSAVFLSISCTKMNGKHSKAEDMKRRRDSSGMVIYETNVASTEIDHRYQTGGCKSPSA